MTWAELCERLSVPGSKHHTRADVARLLRLFTAVVTETVREGDKVHVPGLGVFSRGTRKGRRIRHPATKELMQLDEVVTVKFHAAKAAKEKLR